MDNTEDQQMNHSNPEDTNQQDSSPQASSKGGAFTNIATRNQELFGGAIKIEKFPVTLRDISDFVPISDNQEIFSDFNENNPAYSGNQLILEILEKTDQVDNEAIQYNFNDLAETQNAKDPVVLSVAHFETTDEINKIMGGIQMKECQYTMHTLKGTQKIIPNKKPQGDRDFVTMLMCLVRLNQPYETDLLITFNIPDKHTEEQENSQKSDMGKSQAYQDFLTQTELEFRDMLSTFVVTDSKIKELLGM